MWVLGVLAALNAAGLSAQAARDTASVEVAALVHAGLGSPGEIWLDPRYAKPDAAPAVFLEEGLRQANARNRYAAVGRTVSVRRQPPYQRCGEGACGLPPGIAAHVAMSHVTFQGARALVTVTVTRNARGPYGIYYTTYRLSLTRISKDAWAISTAEQLGVS